MSQTPRFESRICNLEAALYSAGRPLATKDLMLAAGTRSEKSIHKLLGHLIKRYQERGGALEIVYLEDSRISLQLKLIYSSFVKKFNNKPLLRKGPLKTLSYIAFHQPVDQRQVIADRGTHVYSHLKMIEHMGLITRERTEERSYMIKTTSFFGDYFGFSHSPAKSQLQLKQMFRELKITKMDNGDGEGLFEAEGDGFLADPRNGLSRRLPEYSRTSNYGS